MAFTVASGKWSAPAPNKLGIALESPFPFDVVINYDTKNIKGSKKQPKTKVTLYFDANGNGKRDSKTDLIIGSNTVTRKLLKKVTQKDAMGDFSVEQFNDKYTYFIAQGAETIAKGSFNYDNFEAILAANPFPGFA